MTTTNDQQPAVCEDCGHRDVNSDGRCKVMIDGTYVAGVGIPCNHKCVFPPAPTVAQPEHVDFIYHGMDACAVCGLVRPAEGWTRPCKGPHGLSLRDHAIPAPAPVEAQPLAGPCAVCAYHWNLIVNPGDEHSIHCPNHPQNFKLRPAPATPSPDVREAARRALEMLAGHEPNVVGASMALLAAIEEAEAQTPTPSNKQELCKVAGMFPEFHWPDQGLSFSEAVAEQLIQMTRLPVANTPTEAAAGLVHAIEHAVKMAMPYPQLSQDAHRQLAIQHAAQFITALKGQL